MNERIKELSKQAGDYVNETYTGPVRSKTPGKIWEDGHIGWNEQFQEKFAELIVAECVNNYRRKHGEYLRTGRYIDEYEHSNNMLTKLGFKQHFGVEE